MKKRVIWVTWETQLRNRSMARELDVPLYVIRSGRRRILRYLSSAVRTFGVVVRERPGVVICQNPSIVLTLWLLVLRRVIGFELAVDAHYGGIVACTGNTLVQRILNSINHTADLVIVTNETHAAHVRALGGRVFVCPDPLPDLAAYEKDHMTVPKKVFFICSFDIDEPYKEVLLAASMLSADGFRPFVSGDYRRAGIDPSQFPEVQLLGFVPESEYYRHLFSSELVADLTNYDDCLVCGAYEAMAACKPTVLSGKAALREYFAGGTVFTENEASEIAQALKEAYARRGGLAEAAREWTEEARSQMRERVASLAQGLEEL